MEKAGSPLTRRRAEAAAICHIPYDLLKCAGTAVARPHPSANLTAKITASTSTAGLASANFPATSLASA
jgi:hypothetical protein